MSAQIEISRDCDAMLIPSGTQVRLAKGTLVVITHRLGGNFTVSGSFGMARILEKDADAIGEASKNPQNSETKAEAEENAPSPAPEEKSDRENFAPPEESELWDAARTVYDPDCAMGPVIADDLKMRLKAIPGIDDAVVNIVWDPPWHQDMISEEGKMTLGLL